MRVPRYHFCNEYGTKWIDGKSNDGGDTIPMIMVCDFHAEKEK